MQPLSAFTEAARRDVRGVFADIDETLTSDGRLTADAYGALERLKGAGLICIPVTGRPAGWCDHIARMWPVDAVVGENGAFYFRHDPERGVLQKRFFKPAAQRADDRSRLDKLCGQILAAVPGAAVASDQPYRVADLAIDFCEDVPPLPAPSIDRIVAIFREGGATAKISSIHVNGWFGDYDKLTMTRIAMEECFGIDLDAEKRRFVFIGDSPNDAPMFGYFPNSVGVANVRDFDARLDAEPAYVTERRSGAGFAELAEALLAVR